MRCPIGGAKPSSHLPTRPLAPNDKKLARSNLSQRVSEGRRVRRTDEEPGPGSVRGTSQRLPDSSDGRGDDGQTPGERGLLQWIDAASLSWAGGAVDADDVLAAFE